MKIRTLHPKVAPLMATAPVLAAYLEVSNAERLLARLPASEVKQRMARNMAASIAELADFHEEPERDHGFRGDNTRYTLEAVVMTQAELAVLLTRAFEAGHRA